LYDDTYTIDEVRDMLSGLLKSVHNEMEIELSNSSHTSALLLKQLLTQAEKWHLKLNCDVSELENREMLEQIAAFEKKELSLSGANDSNKIKLNPINETGGNELLNKEIERLRAENKNLLSVVHKQEQVVSESESVNKSLMKQVKDLGSTPKNLEAIEELEGQIKNLRMELESKEGSDNNVNEELLKNLSSSKHDLLRVQSELELASKELEKKFQQTVAYKNLKDILTKKNDQIKLLRKTVQKYEPEN